LEARVNELEKKVELLIKAISVMMRGREELSEEEIEEIRSRLNDWFEGRKEEFVDVD